MKRQIYLDHSYNIDQNFIFYKKLEKLGFILDKEMVEHPGKAYCKFISLNGKNKRQRYYLEFVSFGKGAPLIEKEPGLSFGYNENLESFYKKINKKIPAKFSHKNYNWKENSVDRLPGWNMLNFNKPPIKNIFTWFTEYEPNRNRKVKKVPKHKNTSTSLHGIVLELTNSSKKKLEMILGKKIDEKFDMGDETFIYIKKSKKDRFASVIVTCESLKIAKNKIGRSGLGITFEGKEAISIYPKNYENGFGWNLILIQS
jgi:hypothetical protein